ncbi:MAG: hypothetical protein P1V51_08385 [Deltaproteobacteria bacterium]|nr:hypothetical protein [Deltaproteobacteria bacterium]
MVEPPFVVIGDEAPAVVERRARKTVRWASERLAEAYFDRTPDRIVEAWLFRDGISYRRNARRLFGSVADTPYGYYSAADDALVMNIATGGGTLVHEIVHPYVEANLPGCPPWLDEGLGSLYEQSAERDGRIVGLTNWRLPGLQAAIAAGEVPSFEALLAATPHAFYREDRGTNYAQARYLLYYLQEAGLLPGFYARYRRQRSKDPTGYRSLREILGRRASEMAAFQREWERWVMGLRYPAS